MGEVSTVQSGDGAVPQPPTRNSRSNYTILIIAEKKELLLELSSPTTVNTDCPEMEDVDHISTTLDVLVVDNFAHAEIGAVRQRCTGYIHKKDSIISDVPSKKELQNTESENVSLEDSNS